MPVVCTAENTRSPPACAKHNAAARLRIDLKRGSKRKTSGSSVNTMSALLSSQTNGSQIATSGPAPMKAFEPLVDAEEQPARDDRRTTVASAPARRLCSLATAAGSTWLRRSSCAGTVARLALRDIAARRRCDARRDREPEQRPQDADAPDRPRSPRSRTPPSRAPAATPSAAGASRPACSACATTTITVWWRM